MRFIELTKAAPTSESRNSSDLDDFRDTDDVGEPQQTRSTTEAAQPTEADRKMMVAVESIRCFYPRKNNRPGTRITFNDGGGFAFDEDYATVKAMVQTH